MSIPIHTAISPDKIAACYPVMRQLRPELEEARFVERVRNQQETQNYYLIYAEEEGVVVAAAGYRFIDNLHMGFHLYVDDLVTDEAKRGNGYGQALMAWLEREARRAGCTSLHLDSGTQRHPAHRLYIRSGMDIVYYHFRKLLD